MTQNRREYDAAAFESLRPDLVALAYRMLGDAARAKDLVQEAWLRYQGRAEHVDSPRAFLVTVVTRLCLSELGSARARAEVTSGLRLPEPVDVEAAGMGRIEEYERISMAFMVVLERLSAPERAVFLLHEAFDFGHDEIATLVDRTPEASRKLLERARAKVSAGRKLVSASREEHARLLQAFLSATQTGDTARLADLLAIDATLLTDAGPGGRSVGRIRNLKRPLVGAHKIAAFVLATSRAAHLSLEQHELNGRPALVFSRQGQTFGALLFEVADGRIQSLYFQGDPARLRFLGKQTALA